MLDIIRHVVDLRERVAHWRRQDKSIGLVLTMGALHQGHLALVKRSLRACDRTIATIFVNPKQFGLEEDFDKYPRSEQNDIASFTDAGVDLLFAPNNEEIYPKGFSTQVKVGVLGDILEGVHRPNFFDGVATIVSKFLILTRPDKAFFGEKDYQQLMIIKRIVCDLEISTLVEGVETVREKDGLAISSRNIYLNEEERLLAPTLYKTILEVSHRIKSGKEINKHESWGRKNLLRSGFSDVDYLSVHDAETFKPGFRVGHPGRVMVAAKLGHTRLIDNVET